MRNSCRVLGFAACLIAGCGPLTPADQPLATDPTDGRVMRTVVQLNGTAPPTVRSQWITAAEADAEVIARMAREGQSQTAISGGPPLHTTTTAREGYGVLTQAITDDSGCAGSSMWLQTSTNQGGARICFTGSGLVNLADYRFSAPPLLPTWSGRVRSYWAGTSSSNELRHYVGEPSDSNLPTCVEYSLAGRRQDTALQCGQSANYLWLGANLAYEAFGHPTTVPPADPNAPNLYLDIGGGLGRATPTYPVSLNLDHRQNYNLMAVADNPGGVRTVQLHISWTTGCVSGGVTQTSSGAFDVIHTPTDNSTAGAATYTRNTLPQALYVNNGCGPGWTWTGTTYSIWATAINYYGVSVDTQIASLHYT